MSDIIKFRNDIERCISLCNIELEKRKKGVVGESNPQQIEGIILPELHQLLEKIASSDFPPRTERYLLSFAYAFKVWDWNMQKPTKLYRLLLELNNQYKQI